MKLHHLLLPIFSFAFLSCAAAAVETAPTKPNVLFLIVDDLRPELGCYGKDYIKSPNIDALAQHGMVFDRAYVQQAVCSPSRTCVLTGMRPDTTKVWDLKTHFRAAQPEVVTLLQNFKNNGYFVQGMGKIFHGHLNDEPSWSVPWQVPKGPIYALPENVLASPLKVEGEPDDQVSVKKDKKDKKNKKGGADGEESGGMKGNLYECADVPDNTYQDGKVADLAVATLQELGKKKEPFFLAVGFIKPHLPWVSPKKYWDLYEEAKIDLAPNPFYPKDAPDYAIRTNDGEIYQYQGMSPRGRPVPAELAHTLKHAYFAGVSYSDAQIGRVLDELKRLGLDKNTIVILWGDHGWKLGEHAAWGKHSNVENDVNAPLILSVPGMKNTGTHSASLVEFVDIYPTLSELAALPLPSSLEGTSLKPLLDNPRLPWKTAAFSQYPRNENGGLMGYSMRTDRYRFTVWVNKDDHAKVDSVELYDHQTDPQENQNIAKIPANADLVKSLMEQWTKGWQGAKPLFGLPAKNS
jgi:arylsulfatase A-like enzyme